MIVGFFLGIFYTVLSFVVHLLPVISFPSEITAAVTAVGGYLNAWTFIFPVSTLFTVLGLAFVFHFSVMAWHYSHLFLRYIRGR